MLQKLAGDVQREVGRVDDAADEVKIGVQELVAAVHDHDAVRVERHAALALSGEELLDLLAGDEEHRLVGDAALGVGADQRAGVLAVVILLPVPGEAVLVLDLALGALPDGDHGVDDLVGRDPAVLVARLALFVLLSGLDALGALHRHVDGPAHIVGILFDQRAQRPWVEKAAVAFVLVVRLEVHDDLGADRVPVDLRDGVAVRPGARPAHALLFAVAAGEHGDLVRDHERGVEADAELTDDGQILGLRLVHLALEAEGAAAGDDAKIVFGLLQTHADTVVAHGDGAGLFVHQHVDAKIRPVQPDALVGQRQIAELVDRVGRVGEDLTQKDFVIGIDGIDHQVQKPFGFRLELSFCHISLRLRQHIIS